MFVDVLDQAQGLALRYDAVRLKERVCRSSTERVDGKFADRSVRKLLRREIHHRQLEQKCLIVHYLYFQIYGAQNSPGSYRNNWLLWQTQPWNVRGSEALVIDAAAASKYYPASLRQLPGREC